MWITEEKRLIPWLPKEESSHSVPGELQTSLTNVILLKQVSYTFALKVKFLHQKIRPTEDKLTVSKKRIFMSTSRSMFSNHITWHKFLIPPKAKDIMVRKGDCER